MSFFRNLFGTPLHLGAVASSMALLLGCSESTTTTVTTADAGPDATVTIPDDSGTHTPLGPGAALACASSGKNAWETYGAEAFVAVNEQIFTNVFAELGSNQTANLGDSFGKIGSGNPASTSDDAPTFKGKLAAFLVYAYGGPTSITYTDNKTYSGLQDMTEAHTGLNVTSAQYDYFLANIVVPALTAKGVPSGTPVNSGDAGADAGDAGVTADDVSSCFAPILLDASFKASIVGH